MFFLIAAVLTSTSIIVLFKIFEAWKIDNLVAITMNYLVAAGLGFYLCSETSEITSALQQSWTGLAVLAGFMLMATFLVYGMSVQKAGLALTSVAGKMSVVIPVLLGLIFFAETVTWMKILGIILALLAFWLTFRNKEQARQRSVSFYFPIMLFVGTGINDSLLKIAEKNYIKDDFIFFLASAFAVSLILGLLVLGVKSVRSRKVPDVRSLLAGVLLGVLNWYSTYFFLVGMRHFEVSFFVPVFNISLVILAAFSGLLFFRQHLKPINWLGIAAALGAIVLMTL